jgi:cytochrome c553
MKKLMLLPLLLLPLLISFAQAEDLANDENYKARCKVCHGPNAEGKPQMKIPALKTRADRSEAELTKAIEDGNATSTPKMPPFKDKLTADDIKTLVQEIKALK